MRGLGKKQEEQKIITWSRIISLLEIAPFTYEQLQKISGIHRNTLRKSLNDLSDKNIIIDHKYEFEYTSEDCKRYKKLPLIITSLPKHKYYLLNYRNHIEIEYYLDRYYNNYNLLLTKEQSKTLDYIRKINMKKKIILYKIKNEDKIIKKHHLYSKHRERQINLVKQKIRIELDYIHNSDLKYWEKLNESLKVQSNSYLDTVIRFSIDSIGQRCSPSFNPSKRFFPMLNYKTAWYFIIKQIHLKIQ